MNVNLFLEGLEWGTAVVEGLVVDLKMKVIENFQGWRDGSVHKVFAVEVMRTCVHTPRIKAGDGHTFVTSVLGSEDDKIPGPADIPETANSSSVRNYVSKSRWQSD